jgi:ribosome-associated toxin RatA of RatAB toxin-antitoxin module
MICDRISVYRNRTWPKKKKRVICYDSREKMFHTVVAVEQYKSYLTLKSRRSFKTYNGSEIRANISV